MSRLVILFHITNVSTMPCMLAIINNHEYVGLILIQVHESENERERVRNLIHVYTCIVSGIAGGLSCTGDLHYITYDALKYSPKLTK